MPISPGLSPPAVAGRRVAVALLPAAAPPATVPFVPATADLVSAKADALEEDALLADAAGTREDGPEVLASPVAPLLLPLLEP
mmetsp:Transcript_15705/g.32755  ORF Transcript_15705/g.32755 Transcript_15705/m.32755 type:complete len:83 (+) Transcript_15705:728-976(+)